MRLNRRRLAAIALVCALVPSLAALRTSAVAAVAGDHDATGIPVRAVDAVGFTVADMDRAVDFYTRVLTFEKLSDVEVAGREYELLQGVFGARMRIVRMRLGDELLELTEYLTPKGRPIPADLQPNDRLFQHVAIIVSDMEQAYARLRQYGVEHASTGPQRLPDWNPNAGGISAFYFRDPDRHFLEVLHFPTGKGLDKWHRTDRLFLGIDHTAIVVDDTDKALAFYRGVLHLNGVFGARLRITALRAAEGPGIEFLEYLAPRTGRPAPFDQRANDVAHWQTTLITEAPEPIDRFVRRRLFTLVSPGVIALPASPLGLRSAVLVRDPDGHGVLIAKTLK
jgi:catechol 2,3-dioxygenase-like lactoylglutathione lyase family enzyme